jgi:hypothetical protein
LRRHHLGEAHVSVAVPGHHLGYTAFAAELIGCATPISVAAIVPRRCPWPSLEPRSDARKLFPQQARARTLSPKPLYLAGPQAPPQALFATVPIGSLACAEGSSSSRHPIGAKNPKYINAGNLPRSGASRLSSACATSIHAVPPCRPQRGAERSAAEHVAGPAEPRSAIVFWGRRPRIPSLSYSPQVAYRQDLEAAPLFLNLCDRVDRRITQ